MKNWLKRKIKNLVLTESEKKWIEEGRSRYIVKNISRLGRKASKIMEHKATKLLLK